MIDLESIMAKKRLIENEPVLLRDILPKVMNDIRLQLRSSKIAGSGARGNRRHNGNRRQRRSRESLTAVKSRA